MKLSKLFELIVEEFDILILEDRRKVAWPDMELKYHKFLNQEVKLKIELKDLK